MTDKRQPRSRRDIQLYLKAKRNERRDMNKKDPLKEKAKEITDKIYAAYGSGTGVLFGIESRWRRSVETIVRIALEYLSWQPSEEKKA